MARPSEAWKADAHLALQLALVTNGPLRIGQLEIAQASWKYSPVRVHHDPSTGDYWLRQEVPVEVTWRVIFRAGGCE